MTPPSRRLLLLVPVIAALAACAPALHPAPTSTPRPGPVVVSLTFDDGDADNFAAASVLQQAGLHATFFIPSGLVGHTGYMTWDQLLALQAAGNEIGGHSLDHVKLQGLGTADLQHEICDDRTNLVSHGLTPVSFAYPFGNYDPSVKAMLKQCGYLGSRTVQHGPQQFPLSDPYAVAALPYVVSDTALAKLQRYIASTGEEGGGWAVLVFHHVCDSCDYFAVRPDVFNGLIPWLARQQSLGHLQVKTFGAVLANP